MEIKITRKLLTDYRKTRQEISLLETEMGMKRVESPGRTDFMPDYQNNAVRIQTLTESKQSGQERYQGILEQKKAEIRAVQEWIDSIEDVRARCIFRMFYIDGLAWAKIAKLTGFGANADYPRLIIRDKYLKRSGIQ